MEQTKNNSKLKYIILAAITLAVAGILIYRAAVPADTAYSRTGYAMNSLVTLKLYTSDDDTVKEVEQSVFHEITELDNAISWRNEDSQTALINRNGSADDVSEAAELLSKMLDVANKSNGAINPAVLPLCELWGVESESPRLPSQEEIDAVLPLCDYKQIKVDGSNVVLGDGVGVDFGSVGKGAACDKALIVLEGSGVSGAVLSVGGSILVYGEEQRSIGVRDPYGSEESYAGVLKLSGESFVSTSGDYEKFFTEDGKEYHHIFDSSTGYPSDSGLKSVTVVCGEGWLSDALSTACFVLGRQEGAALLNEYGAQGIFIDNDNRVYVTEGIKESFTLTSDNFTMTEVS